MFNLIAQEAAGNVDAGKAIALALGIGLGSLGAGIGIGNIFGSMIQAVARQPELRGELHGHPVARLRAHRGRRLLRPDRRPARLRPGLGRRPRRCCSPLHLDRGRPGSDDLDARLLRDHVLRPAEVRVRPDPEDDRRAPRADPRLRRGGGDTRAPRPGALLEEHKQLIGQAKSEAGEILARGPQRRRRAARARPRGGRGRPPAPARGDAQADRGRDRRARSSRSAPRSPT